MASKIPVHHRNISTYAALVLWGLVGFGISPTFGSLVVHVVITPLAILGLIVLCHWEGREQARVLKNGGDEELTAR